ncbi:hypothetical protein NA57DRAFT_58682 [Rhizodiscina lignyota]|uniref:Uncharacterized protein n=1 Tax=Rhizodiscina lignyota TaxID=1504668 RepID=A0A9P4ICK9_9PEZI|nr:hypothetical protein NA57DRAFT_58682 [Rhizodiscina lignyota]
MQGTAASFEGSARRSAENDEGRTAMSAQQDARECHTTTTARSVRVGCNTAEHLCCNVSSCSPYSTQSLLAACRHRSHWLCECRSSRPERSHAHKRPGAGTKGAKRPRRIRPQRPLLEDDSPFVLLPGLADRSAVRKLGLKRAMLEQGVFRGDVAISADVACASRELLN